MWSWKPRHGCFQEVKIDFRVSNFVGQQFRATVELYKDFYKIGEVKTHVHTDRKNPVEKGT